MRREKRREAAAAGAMTIGALIFVVGLARWDGRLLALGFWLFIAPALVD